MFDFCSSVSFTRQKREVTLTIRLKIFLNSKKGIGT